LVQLERLEHKALLEQLERPERKVLLGQLELLAK
jgi:hypothetical protein